MTAEISDQRIAALIWRWPVSYRPFFRGLLNKLLVIAACVLVIGASVGAFYSTYAPIFREEDKLTHFINPTNYIYAISKYTKQRLGIKKHFVVQAIGEDAVMSAKAASREKKSLMVFVVGETARADHFSLNGYARETNPELSKLDILNFTQVHACGTSTAVSVPCMDPTTSSGRFTAGSEPRSWQATMGDPNPDFPRTTSRWR